MRNDSIRIFIGPMSKNVVDAIIEYNNEFKSSKIGFIPSRRQIDFLNGYVNSWTTSTFSKYVKDLNDSIIIERDHGGPNQGFVNDDGKESYEFDANFFDIIHIDPWKEYPEYIEGLEQTISAINYCYSKNKDCHYEVGTEQAIRYFTDEELERLLSDLRKKLKPEVFSKIIYAVVQSGTGLNLADQINTGKFDLDRLKSMLRICNDNHIMSKEHNGDYLNIQELSLRFNCGLNAINIAPEYGQIETSFYIDLIKKMPDNIIHEFYSICFNSKRWEKWVKSDFDPYIKTKKVIMICGHYIFSTQDFLMLKNKISNYLKISKKELDNLVKANIKNHLLKFNEIISN